MHRPPVTVSDASAGSFASRSVAGNIGLRVISRYHITFDFRRQTVTFAPGKGIDAPFVIDRTGVSLNQTDPGAFVVLSTVAGGPADLAGLHAGDRIIAIGGRNIAQAQLGFLDARPYTTGNRPFTVTTQAKDGTLHTLAIQPRDILP
jgi:S1-C subfamily serine protease